MAEDVAADVVETNCFIMLKCFSLPTKYQEKGPWLPVVESLCETLGIYMPILLEFKLIFSSVLYLRCSRMFHNDLQYE